MSNWRNPYQENSPTTPRRTRNTFRAPLIQSSPDQSPSRSWSSSHSHQLFQSTSQLPPPSPTQPQSFIPQPSTSTLPSLQIPVVSSMDQETLIQQLQQQLQQMQQQMAQFMVAQTANPPVPEDSEAPVTQGASKKIKIPAPEPFDSKREKLKTFLRQCNLVFSGDKRNYEDDQDKITYALSLMRGGIAEEWAGTMMDKRESAQRRSH